MPHNENVNDSFANDKQDTVDEEKKAAHIFPDNTLSEPSQTRLLISIINFTTELAATYLYVIWCFTRATIDFERVREAYYMIKTTYKRIY